MSNRPDEQARRMNRLRALHAELMRMTGLSHKDAILTIAEMLHRSEWTVRIWMSDRSSGYTIPRDALELLEIKLEQVEP